MKNPQIKKLLDQIIEKAEEDDRIHKAQKISSRGSQTVGDSWYVFNLKLLKKLIEEDAH